MQAEVAAGQLQALNLSATDQANVGTAALSSETINGQVYALPFDTQPEGVYYSKNLFQQAGIASTPTTMAELEADVAKLKTINVAPIAVGAKDAWPAAHWYYNFALRECSQDTMSSTAKSLKFTDPCWTKAGDDLSAFLKTSPFQNGFLTTAAQQGAGSLGRHGREPQGGDGADGQLGSRSDRQPDPGPEAAARPRLVPLPRRLRRPGRPERDHGRHRRVLAVQERAEGGAASSSSSCSPRTSRRPTPRRSSDPGEHSRRRGSSPRPTTSRRCRPPTRPATRLQYLDTAVRPERRQRHEHRRGEPDGRQGHRRRHRLAANAAAARRLSKDNERHPGY